MAFLGLGMLISVMAGNKVVASGVAIGIWFLYVLVYDLILLVLTEGRFADQVFPLLLMLNPADVFRVLNIFSMEEVRSLYGLATVFPPALANPWLLGGVMVFWIVAPLVVAYGKFK